MPIVFSNLQNREMMSSQESKLVRLRDLDIQIIRSKRKTVSIFVERDGSLSARIPEAMTLADMEAIVTQREYLIHKHLAEWTQANENKVNRSYVNGQSFLYLGRNYRLKIVDDTVSSLKLKNGYFVLSKNEHANADQLFKQFYKQKLSQKLNSIIEIYQQRLGVKPNEITIMELQNRWASCSTKGTVSFHWKCAMAPIEILHYIVAHELTHLIHPNHSPAFWNELDKIMPNYDTHQKWLMIYGARMDL